MAVCVGLVGDFCEWGVCVLEFFVWVCECMWCVECVRILAFL